MSRRLEAVAGDILAEWQDAYSAFVGAFDTAIGRRRSNNEFEADARRRLREFNDRILASVPVMNEPLACPACGGVEWVDDQNWSPPYPDLPQERVPGDGLITCIRCRGARPIEEPGELERLKRERDDAVSRYASAVKDAAEQRALAERLRVTTFQYMNDEKLSVADEREACAKEAEEDYTPGYGPGSEEMEWLAKEQRKEIAERIRARAAHHR